MILNCILQTVSGNAPSPSQEAPRIPQVGSTVGHSGLVSELSKDALGVSPFSLDRLTLNPDGPRQAWEHPFLSS